MPNIRSADAHAGHADVYAAVFNLVGQKQNETYEDLTKILPSMKESDSAELKELAARKAMRELMNPHKDPLREEYERAAAEEDVDDVCTEDGEWIDTEKAGKEVDEDGIPVVKLARTPSGFILDGPGGVKVDNLTPEADEGDASGQVARGGANVDTTASSNATAVSHPRSALVSAGSSGYLPTAIERAAHSSHPVTGAPTATSPTAARPMSILDSGMLSRAKHPHGPSPQHHEKHHHQGVTEDRSAPQAAGRDDRDDAPEVVPEPSAVLMPPAPLTNSAKSLRGRLANGGRAGGGSQRGSAADVDGTGRSDGGAASCGDEGEQPEMLPGACQDTSREDALWAAMQGVDGLSLVEHLGLAGPQDTAEVQEPPPDSPSPKGQGGPRQQERHVDNSHKPPGRNPPSSGSGNAAPDAGQGGEAAVRQPAAATPGAVALAGRGASARAGSAGVRQAGGEPRCAESNGPTFEEVESFKLDPGFDYDNVALTQREFPYTMLNADARMSAASRRPPSGTR